MSMRRYIDLFESASRQRTDEHLTPEAVPEYFRKMSRIRQGGWMNENFDEFCGANGIDSNAFNRICIAQDSIEFSNALKGITMEQVGQFVRFIDEQFERYSQAMAEKGLQVSEAARLREAISQIKHHLSEARKALKAD